MEMEKVGKFQEANKQFLHAWNEATHDFEKFIAAFYVVRHQESDPDRLKWLEIALKLALKINDNSVHAALPSLYSSIAKCYEGMNDQDKAKENYQLASSFTGIPSDDGPFFHGTKADLKVGDLLVAQNKSNYKSDLIMDHIYFTASANGAGLAAALANGQERERVYIVEPTGSFENDPNVTNQKFPGNPTRSYRTQEPLKIVGEVADWDKTTPEELKKWREKLAKAEGDIIN